MGSAHIELVLVEKEDRLWTKRTNPDRYLGIALILKDLCFMDQVYFDSLLCMNPMSRFPEWLYA